MSAIWLLTVFFTGTWLGCAVGILVVSLMTITKRDPMARFGTDTEALRSLDSRLLSRSAPVNG